MHYSSIAAARLPACLPACLQGRIGILKVHARDKKVDPDLGEWLTGPPAWLPPCHCHSRACFLCCRLPRALSAHLPCLPALPWPGLACPADFQKVARATAGFTGAELMNLMNQSGERGRETHRGCTRQQQLLLG